MGDIMQSKTLRTNEPEEAPATALGPHLCTGSPYPGGAPGGLAAGSRPDPPRALCDPSLRRPWSAGLWA